jgi:hypothetical protein
MVRGLDRAHRSISASVSYLGKGCSPSYMYMMDVAHRTFFIIRYSLLQLSDKLGPLLGRDVSDRDCRSLILGADGRPHFVDE